MTSRVRACVKTHSNGGFAALFAEKLASPRCSALRMRLCRGFSARNRRHSRRISEKYLRKSTAFPQI